LNPSQIVQLDPPQLFDLLGPLKDFFKWMIAELYKLASSIATALTEYVVTPILDALKWLFDKISSLVSSSISQVLNFLREKAPITPEKAWDLLPYVVGLAAAGALGVGAYFTALNIQVAGSGLRSRPFGKIY